MTLVAARPGRAASTSKRERHRLLALTVFLLPFSYIPLEIVPARVSITLVVFALIVLTGIRYRVLSQRASAVDATALLFSAFILIRLTILGGLEGTVVDPMEVTTAVLAPLGGVVLFRVARLAGTKETIRRTLAVLMVFLAAVAVYQTVAGLTWLKSRGYAEGFYYFTFEGSYRTFGTFLSPTVFGAFLAIVGAALVFMAPTLRGSLFWLLVSAVPLALTETRAAWISFTIALLFVSLVRARTRPVNIMIGGVAIAFVGTLFVLLFPSVIEEATSRLNTLGDAGFSSNVARLNLWQGTLDAVAASPLIGLGQQPFSTTVGAYVGSYADYGHAHSNYLQVLYLYGGIGLALFATLLLLSARDAATSIRNSAEQRFAYGSLAALTAFVVDSAFETTWTSLSIVTTLLLLFGLGSRAASRTP